MTKKKQAPEEIIYKLGNAGVVTGMGSTVAKGNRRGAESFGIFSNAPAIMAGPSG